MSLMDSLAISASGMDAQRARLQALAENLANAETTRTPGGGPYLRKDVVFESSAIQGGSFKDHFAAAMDPPQIGVAVREVREDPRAVEMRYQPGHPDADEKGYVAYPRIQPAEEMVNLQSAARAYEANIAVMTATKDMVRRSLELFRT
ncbi:MAG: flagellar basal body rod protein FlgC [Bryobacterales bacterium]|nr:flagellar basal body rod protein FlgC [Bryobacterales bacterium]